MINVAKGLYQFFSSFGIPAYDEETIPDDAKLPYLTYTVADPDWDDTGSITATIWYADPDWEGTSFSEIYAKVDEIKQKIGNEGCRIEVPTGCLWIFKESPYSQRIATNSDKVKAVAINLGFHALCN